MWCNTPLASLLLSTNPYQAAGKGAPYQPKLEKAFPTKLEKAFPTRQSLEKASKEDFLVVSLLSSLQPGGFPTDPSRHRTTSSS